MRGHQRLEGRHQAGVAQRALRVAHGDLGQLQLRLGVLHADPADGATRELLHPVERALRLVKLHLGLVERQLERL